ncbi:hypothetical protein JCM11251_002172 [Rhodosporidiobolus azoricus]
MSLGQAAAGHRLPDKLRAAAEEGLVGIEVFDMCLEAFADEFEGETAQDRQLAAAAETGRLAKELGLEIFVLQPLRNYDGILDEQEHAKRIEEVKFRFKACRPLCRLPSPLTSADLFFLTSQQLCKLMHCDMLQVPANFQLDDGVTGKEEKVLADLREIADLGLQQDPPIRFAYEAMCWSTTNYTWQKSWHIVQKVDRPNFGLVLDGFHIAGRDFADPTAHSGIRIGGYTRLAFSLDELARTVPKEKIFYIELADAELLDVPLSDIGAKEPSKSPFHVEGQQPRMSWSRNCRLFPYEEDRGGYMPMQKVMESFLDTGYEGYLSFEIFHRDLFNKDPGIPAHFAQRAKRSWEKMKDEFGL